jgi:hypothetical protein
LGRGVAGSKRSRAAEVHNLSERVSKDICHLSCVTFETTHISLLSLFCFQFIYLIIIYVYRGEETG